MIDPKLSATLASPEFKSIPWQECGHLINGRHSRHIAIISWPPVEEALKKHPQVDEILGDIWDQLPLIKLTTSKLRSAMVAGNLQLATRCMFAVSQDETFVFPFVCGFPSAVKVLILAKIMEDSNALNCVRSAFLSDAINVGWKRSNATRELHRFEQTVDTAITKYLGTDVLAENVKAPGDRQYSGGITQILPGGPDSSERGR